jgi:hypothetical protein
VGKPLSVEEPQWDQMRYFIYERFVTGNPATTNELLEFLSKRCNVDLAPDTLRKKLRSDPELRRIRGIPMEKGRAECDPNDIQVYFEDLAKLVDGKPAAFVFNLDESGFQDWVDKRVRHVIVPVTYEEEEIPIPVD